MSLYFDNAATTKPSPECLEDLQWITEKFWANPSSKYMMGHNANLILEESRKIIADTINAKPEEIIFTSSGSEANNLAIKGYLSKHLNHPVISSQIEHPSVYNTLRFMSDDITYLSSNQTGEIQLHEIQKMKYGAFVSLMHGNNEVSTLNNIKSITNYVHEHEGVVHTDAVQTWCHIPIDVKYMGVDMLSASSHKINSIRGAGFLYKREGLELFPLIHGGHQEFDLRAGTENLAAIYCMAQEALRKNVNLNYYMKELNEKSSFLIKEMYTHITSIGIRLNGSSLFRKRIPGNLSFTFEGIEADQLITLLDDYGVSVSAGSACSSGEKTPSRILKSIGMTDDEAFSTVRVSLGMDNSEEDIAEFVQILNKCITYLKEGF